ncbi:hypothetical protein HU200_031212 [Digitaria exilis]|uniref:Uncharacterized protein n=1 Tax=Digitaria exilis TaxID=1010633 RepID=A0A835BMK6_9POAL|nr:hypothetical protein HU200_031212 [Digitaria exilis]CAB3476241.1 unnamed protein product [Digitaria exilis]
MSTNTSTLKMKLLVDTKAKRVVFAEASKGVVDFLFSLLQLPVATIVKMLGTWSMPGSIGNLYWSLVVLDDDYILPGAKKKSVLKPAVVPSAASSLLLPAPASGASRCFYKCSSRIYSRCSDYVTETRGMKCPSCHEKMKTALKFVADDGSGSIMAASTAMATGAAAAKGGLVQGVVTYTVMDDLTVTPMSTISGISMLNAAGVADFAALQEKTVRIGYAEGLAIVKASLHSKTVLTDVFLSNKRPRV